MFRSQSQDSFFKRNPSKPLINSYRRFLLYLKKNNIKSNQKSKEKAFFIFLDSFKMNFFKYKR